MDLSAKIELFAFLIHVFYGVMVILWPQQGTGHSCLVSVPCLSSYRRDPFPPPEVSRPPVRHGMAERPAFDCVIIVTTPKLRCVLSSVQRRVRMHADICRS